MEISEKVAYLKGLAEGLALDTESKEGKLIAAIIDVLDDMSGKFEDLEDELCDVEDGTGHRRSAGQWYASRGVPSRTWIVPQGRKPFSSSKCCMVRLSAWVSARTFREMALQ